MLKSQRTLPLYEGLPKPSFEAERPCLRLIDLAPKTYVDTKVRVTKIKSKEKEDELGKRPYIFGIAEDSTFRTPFICYKPYQSFFQHSVFRFQNAYAHQFEDESILLILTEYSSIKYLSDEDPKDYFWNPKIGRITRPLGFCRVTLQGIVSKVYQSSGFVKRCEKCQRVIFNDSCPSGHNDGWHWSVRISGKLSDETGSINTIFSQYLTCKLLGRTVSEILYMANVPEGINCDDFDMKSFQAEIPAIPIYEATVIEPDLFRQCKQVIVPDFNSSKIYCPKNVKVRSSQIVDVKERELKCCDEDDRKLLRKIFEKALDLQIRKHTKLPKLHGIYLVEEPVRLYWTEEAKLYLGFELCTSADSNFLNVEVYPQGLIRESVFDYVQWRRKRGASAKSIERNILKWRKNVILAPNGTVGRISKLVYEDAGSFQVPGFNVSLPEFWKMAYDIEVKEDERPLLVIKPYNLDMELTYPPSCVFFDEQSIYLRSSVLRFVNYKRSMLKHTAFNVALNALKDLRIGEQKVEMIGETKNQLDAQRLILHDIKEKLLGKNVKATGSVIQANNQLYFFPKSVSGVS